MEELFSTGWIYGRLLLVHSLSPELARQLLFQMKRIRFVEEEIARRYPEGEMRCPTHLSIGQEAVAAGVGLALASDDMVVSGHRAHAHYLGKGGSLNAMLAEIYGKIDGCSQGKGGSMHLIDESVGFMGSTAIVAGTIPVGVGLALSMKIKGTNQVSCIFHGDAAVEAGVFYESVNFAALKDLPVLFICENNLYSVYSPLSVRQPKERCIATMVSAMGITTLASDGNDANEVYALTYEAVQAIKNGGGPMLIEFSTYRWLEHCGPNFDNDIGYRTQEEFEKWKSLEPISRFEQALMEESIVNASDINAMLVDIKYEVDSAFKFAEASAFPEQNEASMGLYA